ncbi:hypothetical protein ACWD4V_27265 [Streptomyces tsukubensis]|uniref:hypothetical protein n=1 Tax=Streptomyces tsukubensis TaxID=83656 RepID=UPI00367D0173
MSGQNGSPGAEKWPSGVVRLDPAVSSGGPEQGTDRVAIAGQGVFETFVTTMPFITSNSRVFVSLAEIDPNGDRKPFMGAAPLTVHNVVARDDHTLQLRLEINWPEELVVVASIAYFNV